jgi:phytoene dehydrogenase-like protein
MSTGPSRRAFLAKLAAGLAAPLIATPLAVRAALASSGPEAPALVGLTNKSGREIVGGFVNDDAALGHQLRDGTLARAARSRDVRRTRVAIVGGGMSGLSAGWRLDQLGVREWLCLELGDAAGGNSRGGENRVSRYPWGAHYVPVPSPEATHVRALLREVGVLHADGSWDERTLCHSPQERIWQHGEWHEGLEPLDAAPAWERAEWERFDAQVAAWRATGAFRVPLAGAPENVSGAAAAGTQALDRLSASAWFASQGYRSPTLRWWIEYGTRDDYGASLDQASAWAAAHYFAGRPPEDEGPLTWPEGNAFLVNHLTRTAGDRVVTKAPAYAIEARGSRWLVRTPAVDIDCDCVIWAAPLFVLPRVMPAVKLPVSMEYAPWVVANITLDRRPQERGAPMSWDNVIYGSPSLGYVSATHQFVGRPGPQSVWTWYHAVVDRPAAEARTWLQQRPWSAWRDDIVGELSRAHPDIAECITRIDVRQWGHAMARPTPGVLTRNATLARWSPAPRVFMAHADLSGLSLFEEAQWHGVQAAERAARVLGG